MKKSLNRKIYGGKRAREAPKSESSQQKPVDKTTSHSRKSINRSASEGQVAKRLSYCHFCDLKVENSEKLIEHFSTGHNDELKCLGCKQEFKFAEQLYIHIYEKLFGVQPMATVAKKEVNMETSKVENIENVGPKESDGMTNEKWNKSLNGIEDSFELPVAKRALIDLDLEENMSLSNIQLDEAEFKHGMKAIGFRFGYEDDDYQLELLLEK
jgi:hypothetical protein